MYPADLEKWWDRKIRESGFTLSQLRKEIQYLRDNFTIRREKHFQNYANDKKSWLAYGVYLFPQTFVKLRIALLEVLNKGFLNRKSSPFRILDLGTGTGAGLFSAISLLSSFVNKIESSGVDRSEIAFEFFKEIQKTFYPEHELNYFKNNFVHFERIPHEIKSKRWNLIIMNYSLGEAFFGVDDRKIVDWLKSIISVLEEDGVLLIIEPALRETAERLERLRDFLIDNNLAVIYAPCPHSKPCPLLKEGRFWCHEVREWMIPETLKEIEKRFNYTLREIKFSFLAMGNKEYELPSYFRFVTPVTKVKGKYIARVCGYDGELHSVDILKKDINPIKKKILHSARRGDEIDSELTKLFRFGIEIPL